ncbi:hypothetical protein JAAARDRAFT_122967 [Jaapia argillacea MUCL 33604]|uniref:F-box domain-containing protein n=1 Tax=Jaapia argillacea MUCL 33604 TaxID=933084 RepID=A0A067QDU7_9AGAM|nr:hypothetical protein JAAARDRAFT_122967 [Jaapia argillacea MUCL 33604]
MEPSTQYHSVHRALCIPELLKTIFLSLNDSSSNAKSARVCKKWSEIALDVLWEELNHDSHYRLFSILAPLKPEELVVGASEPRRYVFTTSLTPVAWQRFDYYAPRVRGFVYQPRNETKPVHESVFQAMALSRPQKPLLPNLRALAWYPVRPQDPQSFALLFMHEGIRELAVGLTFFGESARIFAAYVVDRMSSLTSLTIRHRRGVREVEEVIMQLVKGLKELNHIVVPMFHLTGAIAEAMSKLPRLQSVKYGLFNIPYNPTAEVFPFTPSFQVPIFPILYHLSMTVSLMDLSRLLHQGFPPPSLTRLALTVAEPEPSTKFLRSFLRLLSTHCPLLRALYISFRVPRYPTIPADPIVFRDLEPIFQFENLRSLTVVHPLSLVVSQSEIERIALRWPLLEFLSLTNEPMRMEGDDATLTLEALIPLLQHCPNIGYIGLYLRADDLPPNLTRLPQRGAKALTLALFCSIVQDPASVALILSRFSQTKVVISTSPQFKGRTYNVDEALLESRISRWKEVERLLPLFTQARNEGAT